MTLRRKLRHVISRAAWRRLLPMGMVLSLMLSGVAHQSPDASAIASALGWQGAPEPGGGGRRGLWTGSAHITFSRKTNDFAIGYTMRSDFWFRVDADGNVRGKAYAVYQPTFDPAGVNGKITVAKSIFNGALSIVPGGQIGVFKSAVEAGKNGTQVALGGLVGVVGEYKDPEPVRTGEITGALRDAKEVGGGASGTLTVEWADEAAKQRGIPATVSLQYINKKQPLTQRTLDIQGPWQKPATIDPDSDGRFAVAQDQQTSSTGGVSESTFSYWSATRVE